MMRPSDHDGLVAVLIPSQNFKKKFLLDLGSEDPLAIARDLAS
jgi:hypothetical protein